MAERRWPEHIDSVVEEFDDCFDSMERYELLFEYAKNTQAHYLPMNGMRKIKSMAVNLEHM